MRWSDLHNPASVGGLGKVRLRIPGQEVLRLAFGLPLEGVAWVGICPKNVVFDRTFRCSIR